MARARAALAAVALLASCVAAGVQPSGAQYVVEKAALRVVSPTSAAKKQIESALRGLPGARTRCTGGRRCQMGAGSGGLPHGGPGGVRASGRYARTSNNCRLSGSAEC